MRNYMKKVKGAVRRQKGRVIAAEMKRRKKKRRWKEELKLEYERDLKDVVR